jgi:hypothetical protein
MGTLSADLTGVRRFGSPVLPLFRCGNRALSIPVVRCWRQMLISTAIPYNFRIAARTWACKRADLSMLGWSMLRSRLTSTLDSEPRKPAPRDI